MMDVHEWNRKDALPDQTIERFVRKLDEIGIGIDTVHFEGYQDYWYSNRIEVKGLASIGTNGKGITKEYTLASALGEFFERLQCGMLLDYVFPFIYPTEKDYSETDRMQAIKGFMKFFPHVCDELPANKVEEMINENVRSGGVRKYVGLSNLQEYIVPENVINVLCGANGTAAGNTYVEAFVQGISEIFERYVTQHIFLSEQYDSYFTIDEAVLKDLKSYRLIEAIKKRNYSVRIIDCSLEGKLPVIGVLVIDPSKTKYYFKLGADANVDIALQRCITEIFQGSSFDINFKMKMKEILFSGTDEKDFWNDDERAYEHIKAQIDGTGRLPRGFLRRIFTSEIREIRGFLPGYYTNNDACKYMLKASRSISDEVAVTNYTKYGVPCVRILIPGACASLFSPEKSNVEEVLKSIREIRELFKQRRLVSVEALELIDKILSYPAYSYEFSLPKLLGVITKKEYDAPYLYSPYLFAMYLALYLKNYDMALKYQKIYFTQSRISEKKSKIIRIGIIAIKNNVTEQELMQYLGAVEQSVPEDIALLYSVAKYGLDIPTCPDCELCNYAESCASKEIARIRSRMNSAVQDRSEDQFYEFVGFCQSVGNMEIKSDEKE